MPAPKPASNGQHLESAAGSVKEARRLIVSYCQATGVSMASAWKIRELLSLNEQLEKVQATLEVKSRETDVHS